jgi:hypothetical protein
LWKCNTTTTEEKEGVNVSVDSLPSKSSKLALRRIHLSESEKDKAIKND